MLVALWVCIAYSIGGLALAVRASLLFMIPLSMIWLPDLLARIALRDDHWDRDFSPPASGSLVRIVAWLIILGVPLAWLLLFRAAG
ncbi:hypothetical protein [Luteolibacter marinus]|uniref:hypothetical protein n=1 Tax=Luteolibacter marinus TaxID=2776705 RepID=UPI001866B3E7|nr:hypothetical protein [Luteolibacter marinus]